MRALAVTALTSGCVISAPEGALQYWPPALGVTVEAVVAGDLDADGATDIVVFSSGNENQAGMYYLQGRADFTFNTGNLLRSFTRFVPTDFTRPISARAVAGVVRSIFVADSATHLSVTRLTNTLEVAESGETTIDGGSPTVWTMPVTFPGGMPHYAVSNGTFIDHLSPVFTDPRPIPAPGAPTWDRAELVTSYAEGADQVVVVATRDGIERAVLPRMPGSMFAWESVRGGGPGWFGQTIHDFDGDMRPEVIGFDLAGHRLCVVDPGAPLPVTPSCIELTSSFSGEDVTLIVGTNLTMNPGLDILVAQASGTATNYTIVEDVTYLAGTLTAAISPRALPVAGPPRGRTVIATDAPGTPFIVITFGTDGAAACVLGPC